MESSQELLGDWAFIRGNTLAMVEHFSGELLNQRLNRPGLNTAMKHFEEMADVQESYILALEAGTMGFENVLENDDYLGTSSVTDIKNRMESLDSRLVRAINEADSHSLVDWGEYGKKGILSHLVNLCMHEALHVGQLIGFCYSQQLGLPEGVVADWSLS